MTGPLQLLLLLLLPFGSRAAHYYGTVMTFTPKDSRDDGSLTVVFHYKLSFRACTDEDTWDCVSGSCGTQTVELNIVDVEGTEWCQREGVMIRKVSSNAPFQLRLDGSDWMSNVNRVSNWRAVTQVDLRTRSDTALPNKSPQTTILPTLRVPSNCQRTFRLLAFDSDGDQIRCRFGDTAANECNPCSPPSVLTITPVSYTHGNNIINPTFCTLLFHPVRRSEEGSYAVQLEMEDFPIQKISLHRSDGVETTRTPTDALSKIPVRFGLKVGPPVPSCSEGVHLPKFLPPSPPNGAHMTAYVDKKLNITIMAKATRAQVLKLMFSGPHGVVKHAASHGEFILSWTPSEREDGEDHPICFVVQAEENTVKYHSELRCVIVSVHVGPIATLPPFVLPTTTTVLPTTTTVLPTTTTWLPTTTTWLPTTLLPTTTPESMTTLPFVNVTGALRNVLDETQGSGDGNTDAGKVVGIVLGVGVVAVIGGIAFWAFNRNRYLLLAGRRRRRTYEEGVYFKNSPECVTATI